MWIILQLLTVVFLSSQIYKLYYLFSKFRTVHVDCELRRLQNGCKLHDEFTTDMAEEVYTPIRFVY